MGNFVLEQLASRSPVMKTVSLPRGRTRLHTMPTTTGYEVRTDERYSWDGRKRGQTAFTVLQHTVAGAGNLRFERRTHRLQPGETLLLTVPHDHRYWVEEGGRWEFFWISMTGQEALRIHRNIQAAFGPVLTLSPATVELLADCSLRLIEGASEAPGRASAIAYEAMMALFDDVFGAASGAPDPTRAMRFVVEHIRANLRSRLSVPELAAFTGLSRAHFSRQFAASLGMPPAEFVLQERMRRAAKLLVGDAAIPIKEVAVTAGFEDANYFSKVFRRVYGQSPGEFRVTGMYAGAPPGDAVSNSKVKSDAV